MTSYDTFQIAAAPINKYPALCEAAEHLSRSDRGARALKNLSLFFREGGSGLDEKNKRAALALFMAALSNPWDLPADLTQPKSDR